MQTTPPYCPLWGWTSAITTYKAQIFLAWLKRRQYICPGACLRIP